MTAAPRSSPLRAAVGVLQGILVVAWPVLVLVGDRRLGTRGVALLLLALALPALARTLAQGARGVRVLLGASGGPVILLVLAALLDRPGFLLAYPALVNAVLLAQFALSLRGGGSIVERFARLSQPELEPAEVRYCRGVTGVWCAFFAANGLAAALLALLAPRAIWAAYTGGISYVLIGLLFAAEYLVRKVRFGRFGSGPVDRVLARLLGASSPG